MSASVVAPSSTVGRIGRAGETRSITVRAVPWRWPVQAAVITPSVKLIFAVLIFAVLVLFPVPVPVPVFVIHDAKQRLNVAVGVSELPRPPAGPLGLLTTTTDDRWLPTVGSSASSSAGCSAGCSASSGASAGANTRPNPFHTSRNWPCRGFGVFVGSAVRYGGRRRRRWWLRLVPAVVVAVVVGVVAAVAVVSTRAGTL